MQNGAATLEEGLAVSFNVKRMFVLWPIGPCPSYSSKLKIYVHKNLYINVSNSFTHNCQNLEATETYFGKWMDK